MIALIMVPVLAIDIVLGNRFGRSRIQDSSTTLNLDVDLPCPWCFAPTSEQDRTCPSCGRRFGSTQAGELDATRS